MGDPEQVPKRYQQMDFDELADAPLKALGLADHRLIRRAQAIVNLAGPRR
jgi:hypothetical protein